MIFGVVVVVVTIGCGCLAGVLAFVKVFDSFNKMMEG